MKKLTNKMRSAGLATALAFTSCLLPSCGGGDAPKEEAPKGGAPTYTVQQQVFSMCMLSNISAHYNKKGNNIQDSTVMALKAVLSDAGVQSLVGNWQCIWGPTVVTNPDGSTARNTMFIVQRPGTDSFIVAIAGTDPSSTYDWFDEDFDVAPVLWKKWDVLAGVISGATYTGLTTLKQMTSNDSTAQQVLAARVNSLKGGQIFVTGHSLGGALSPAYALHLVDSMSYWTSYKPTINCLAVAGASPGDALFADYYNKKLGATTTRVWNTRDVVPHGFAEYMLHELPTLYPSDSVGPMPVAAQIIVDSVEKTVALINYTQLHPSTNDSFTSYIYTADSMHHTGNLPPVSDTSYLGQALFQHIPSYGVRFGTLSFQQAVQRVLSLPDPFFTEAGILKPVVNNGQVINP